MTYALGKVITLIPVASPTRRARAEAAGSDSVLPGSARPGFTDFEHRRRAAKSQRNSFLNTKHEDSKSSKTTTMHPELK
jgi:hypothetical protein